MARTRVSLRAPPPADPTQILGLVTVRTFAEVLMHRPVPDPAAYATLAGVFLRS
ncbi:hypothetical protein ACWEOZ_16260 [Actinoplanes sp. NPDC004185]